MKPQQSRNATQSPSPAHAPPENGPSSAELVDALLAVGATVCAGASALVAASDSLGVGTASGVAALQPIASASARGESRTVSIVARPACSTKSLYARFVSTRTIITEPLTRAAFAPFGQVIEPGDAHHPINSGAATRFHDLAQVEALDGRACISIVRGRPKALPLVLRFVERHPLGTQTFHPLAPRPFLVVVAPDEGGRPGRPRAFLTKPGQGINYARGTWHGVLTPLDEETDFLVVDRVGEGDNCEEHHFDEPWTVTIEAP